VEDKRVRLLDSQSPIGERRIRFLCCQQNRGLGARHSAGARGGTECGCADMIRQVRNEKDIVLAEAKVHGIEFPAQLLDGLRNSCLPAGGLILGQPFVPLGCIDRCGLTVDMN
jgi:hypothetical protein